MKVIEINVVKDVLHSRTLLHDLGKPVMKYIKDQLPEPITIPTMVVVDLREANPLDYEFINSAFDAIVREFTANSNLFLIFRIGRWEMDELCTGLLDIMGAKTEANENDREALKRIAFSLVTINHEDQFEYLSNLTEHHMAILEYIDKAGTVSSNEILEKFLLTLEETVAMLADLTKAKFIFSTESSQYHALKSQITTP